MDNLTHALTGVMLSRAGLNRLTPHASWLLLLAANSPDCDVVSGFFGANAYLEYHRAFTHSILFVPVIAILPVLLTALIFRQKLPWLRAWLVAMVGVASHLLLDFTNPYGIRLFLPFSDEWPSLDITNVIDVWIWAALGIALIAPAISRLVASEIGAQKTSGRGWAIFALLFLVAYDGARAVLHKRGLAVQHARLYEGQSPKRVKMMPTAINPMRWQGFVETDTLWAAHEVNLNEEFDPASGTVFYKKQDPLIDAAKRDRLFVLFGKFSQTPHWSVSGDEVELRDLRFGFFVKGRVEADGSVRDAKFSF